MFEIVIGILLAAFAAGGVWSFLVTRKAKKDGVETTAVVSRVQVHEWGGTDPAPNVTEDYFITYTARDGQTVEAMLTNPKGKLAVGDKMIIRYLPDRQDFPVMVERL